jgi:ABC-type transporter Mla MlaB component
VYRNLQQYPNAEAFPGILLYRVDAPLYFANVNYIRDQLRGYILHNPANVSDDEPAIQYVIVEMSPMSHIDATGLSALSEIIEELEDQGIQLALANPSASVIQQLELDNIPERLGKEWIFVRMHDAIQFCRVSPRAGRLHLLLQLPSCCILARATCCCWYYPQKLSKVVVHLRATRACLATPLQPNAMPCLLLMTHVASLPWAAALAGPVVSCARR